MQLRHTPPNSTDQLRHDRAKISYSSRCTIERGGYGYGKWFELPGTIEDTQGRIYVVLGWNSENAVLEHPALAAQRGFDYSSVPAGGFVFEDSTGFYVYGASGAYGSGSIDAAGIIEEHLYETGKFVRVIRSRP